MSWDADIIGTGAGPFDTEAFMECMKDAFDVEPVYFSSEGRPLCCGYIHTRMLLRKRLYLNNILSVEKSTFDKVREFARSKGIGKILSSMFAQWDYDADKYGIVKLRPAFTSLIDLTKCEKDIMTAMKKPFRNGIAKSQRSGLVFRQSDDYETFFELYSESHREAEKDGDRVDAWDKRRLLTLLRPMKKLGYVRLFMVEKDGVALNSAVVACFNGSAHYWHGGMRQENKSLCGGNMLHWEIMKTFKAQDYRTYDLGGISIHETERHKQGVINFKESMGGSRKEFYMGQINL